MLTDFDKDYLKIEFFKQLYRYQLYSHRPNLLGLIQQDNSFCCSGYRDYRNKDYSIGNTSTGYQNFNNYLKKFKTYTDLLIELGDQPIYPTKEMFLELLFINGKYNFLNFSKLSFLDSQIFDNPDDGSYTEVIYFDIYDFHEDVQVTNFDTKHTKIRKDNVIRFFNRKLTHAEHFDDDSCYLTITMDKTSDIEFNELFKASNFTLDGLSCEHPIQFKINDFIKKIIKDGEEFTANNPTNGHYDIRIEERYFDMPIKIDVLTEDGELIYVDFDKNISSDEVLKVGSTLPMNNKYRITNIKVEQTTKTLVIVKKEDK
jgi:hypothetical protein